MRQLLISALILLATTLPAKAEDFLLEYAASWNGLPVGTMQVSSKEIGQRYEYQINLNSAGLVRSFTKYWSANTSKGTLASGNIIPLLYTTYWERKKEKQEVKINYSDNGKTLVETATPPEKRPKRPIVDAKDKNNSLDTVAAAMFARREIKRLAESKAAFPQKITIPVFDARRRFDVELTINGYKKKRYKGEEMDLLEIKFFRTPIAGFNDKEITRAKQQDPTVTFYLDSDFFPLFGTGNAPFGTANFEVTSICKAELVACKK